MSKRSGTVLLSITFPGKHFLQLWISLNRVFAPLKDVDRAIMFGPGMRMAILGQIMCISLGIDGGIAKGTCKNTACLISQIYDIAGKGVEEEIANRDPELGNTVESLNKWRDKALVEILKIQKML